MLGTARRLDRVSPVDITPARLRMTNLTSGPERVDTYYLLTIVALHSSKTETSRLSRTVVGVHSLTHSFHSFHTLSLSLLTCHKSIILSLSSFPSSSSFFFFFLSLLPTLSLSHSLHLPSYYLSIYLSIYSFPSSTTISSPFQPAASSLN
ncbi:hypothetical protein ASPTUDRAFT_892875 [Aspergillus tubingensis CBS 134.48]|uniref:Uncharacterized protein n=1 Tax=Aspergillus tubingensis (strain CBS 134.48) TaxID=767770 RepID=A0A1L9MRN3_ASPTC|nr:hypothetical protein ASPTUDRAFT_892875 [Aspergillus tubingensis CBS 134.48]